MLQCYSLRADLQNYTKSLLGLRPPCYTEQVSGLLKRGQCFATPRPSFLQAPTKNMSDKKGVSAGGRGTWIEIEIFADVWYGVVQVMVWVGYGDGYGTARVGAGGGG